MRTAIIIVLVVTLIIGGFIGYYFGYDIGYEKALNTLGEVTNFEECAAAGNPVAESYPRQCRANGQNFIENVTPTVNDKSDLIKITFPRPSEVITSPLEITGEARGTWFFEASFPVELISDDGSILAQGIATAEGEWMTEDFVPFSATLEFMKPFGQNGTLVLKKDNPSGLPEHDDEIRIPVRF